MPNLTDVTGDNMARRPYHPGPPTGFVTGAPKEAIMAEFGRRLNELLVQRSWNQSDLARHAAKHMPDKKFHRDNISQYVRGLALPGPVRLKALANAFGMKPEDLLPTRGQGIADERSPPLEVRFLPDGLAWLRINQAVPQDIAMKILGLLGQQDQGEPKKRK